MAEAVTWTDVVKAEPGHVFSDFEESGIRVRVLRGPASLCAYVGVPTDHPLVGFRYDDIPLDVHGGLTYAGAGLIGLGKDLYWFGWDYAHSGDYCVYYDTTGIGSDRTHEKRWLPGEVAAEAREAAKQLARLRVEERPPVDRIVVDPEPAR